ncbi:MULTISPECIES: ABC transporter ATPase [unclassified Methylobacterium]|uniref:ABC transporter ATPase n=1 Tax=unclassified Methylobacterium TaxID=2615210 RepID=UPI0011C201CF|nr:MULTISPECIES: ABC transporter ATPase [unclassified Methylobacterium]QEE40071.1 ABC transporter ATPase [Methylobacterium sp. WL1]TXN53386.1 ABC transporter ATPase [Methylobacterium sp. WL2]
MRTLLPVLALTILAAGSGTARAQSCDTLIDKVTAATAAKVTERRSDYASFADGPDMTLSLACSSPDLSSVGAQYRGASPPEVYFETFGRAGHAVTGIDAATITEAAHKAQAASVRLRHSNVDLGGARITCSAMVSPDKGSLTLCAVIEHSDRS